MNAYTAFTQKPTRLPMSHHSVRTYSPLNMESFGADVARGYEAFQDMAAVMQDVDWAGLLSPFFQF